MKEGASWVGFRGFENEPEPAFDTDPAFDSEIETDPLQLEDMGDRIPQDMRAIGRPILRV